MQMYDDSFMCHYVPQLVCILFNHYIVLVRFSKQS